MLIFLAPPVWWDIGFAGCPGAGVDPTRADCIVRLVLWPCDGKLWRKERQARRIGSMGGTDWAWESWAKGRFRDAYCRASLSARFRSEEKLLVRNAFEECGCFGQRTTANRQLPWTISSRDVGELTQRDDEMGTDVYSLASFYLSSTGGRGGKERRKTSD